jgi:hypothetical protein
MCTRFEGGATSCLSRATYHSTTHVDQVEQSTQAETRRALVGREHRRVLSYDASKLWWLCWVRESIDRRARHNDRDTPLRGAKSMKKSLVVVSVASIAAVTSTASAQVSVQGQVQAGVQVQVPTIQVQQPTVAVQVAQPQPAQVVVAQPAVRPAVVAPVAVAQPVVITATQWREADDDPETEPPMVATVAPPAPRAEVAGAVRPGFVWVAGNWRWRDGRWVWRPGRWMRPRMAGAVWVPGRWERNGSGFVWVRGSWQPGPAVAVAPPAAPAVAVAQPAGAVVVNRPGGAVVVNTAGPGATVVRQRPNGAVVVNPPGPGAVVVSPHGDVRVRGGGRVRVHVGH